MKTLAALSLVLSTATLAHAQQWPQFRGPMARGVVEGRAVPTEWNVESGRNVAWKTAIPGLAHSSPIVWGERLFVTSAVREDGEAKLSSLYGSPGYGAGESEKDEGEHAFKLYCLDKRSGVLLWERTAHEGVPKTRRHPKSSHANSTPAADAKHVVAFFGSDGIYCYDHRGELLWKRDLGTFDVGAPGYDEEGFQWGFASSPVLVGGKVVVQCDNEGESFLAALSLEDGKELWRTARDEDSTWSTPTVHATSANGGAQVIVNGYKHIGGYDLETGEQLWKLVGGGDVPVPTPVVAGELVFLTSAHGRSAPVRAVHVEARGLLDPDPDESEHHVWSLARRGIYMQTPIVCGEFLYCCSDGGILGCYDAETGEEVYRERLGRGTSGFSGSAVAVNDRLYFTGESGEVFVVKAGYEFEVAAVNAMGENCMTTPAVSEGTLFFRTRHHVVAIRDESDE